MPVTLQEETRQTPMRAGSLDDLRFDEDDNGVDSSFFSLPPKSNSLPPKSNSNSNSNINSNNASAPRGKRRGRRRPRPGSIPLDVEPSKVLKSPKPFQKPRRNSMLARFLSARTNSTSKRNNATTSTTNSTSSGETVSNTAEPDNTSSSAEQVLEHHNNNSSSNSVSSSPMFRSLTQIVRRNTMDTAASIHSTSIMSPHDYAASLLKLKNRAHDLQEQGKTELAIEMWQEALELAEEQQDTLTNKTEILCRLVQLHLKLAYAQEMDTLSISDDEEEEEVNPQRMARRQSQLIRPGLLETFHHLTAKRYLHRIIPGLVQPAWLGPPTKQLMDFFNQVQAWEVAIIIADQLLFQEGLEQDHEKLATMHYQVASQKLDAQRNAEALQHLQATVTYLQKVPIEQRDMVLYLQVLHLLATEYQAQQEYDSAMETCKEQMIHTPPQKRPSLHCQIARNYLAMGQLDTALEQIDLAKKLHLEVAHEDIRLQILQIKGDVFFRLGRHEESLECYEQALHEVASSPADKAELLYTMGRLCVKLGRVRSAITYFTRELAITKQELGSNHLSVSRVLHQLAKLYDEGLGEHKMALLKYNKALGVELAVLQECHVQVTACVNCNPVTHRMCSRHGNMQRQISTQIRETKRCQGRVHYKLGDLERAMQTSFSEPSPRGRERRHTLR